MKYAFFGVPHTGGTYSVFLALREGLLQYGIEVRWLGVGATGKKALVEYQNKEDLAWGDAIASDVTSDQEQASRMNAFLEEHGYDGVFVNVLASRVQTNAIRYLTPHIKRIMLVHNITPGTYAAARAVRDYVHATIGVSPRIRDDLVNKYGFSPVTTYVIPNGINLRDYNLARQHPAQGQPVRILFLGRVIDADKGVFWLPQLLAKLPSTLATLTVAGDGPDLPELRERLAPYGEQVSFIGRVAPKDVPEVMARHDIFIFPSRFEGLGISLIEAMAAGCVPVASRIRGVTDYVINDGVTGYLMEIGDVATAARLIRGLSIDREAMKRVSHAAQQAIMLGFGLSNMTSSYQKLLLDESALQQSIAAPLAITAWRYPRGLRAGLRSYLPNGIKNILRVWRERMA